MKTFAVKLLLLVLPFFAVLGLPAWYIVTSGESFRDDDRYVADVVAGKTEYLYGMMLDESPYRYVKYRILNAIKTPEVLALGSSRVLQFRKEMFTKHFYNAGYIIKDVSEFQTLMATLPRGKYPKVIIVGLDQWMFNPAWDDLRTAGEPYRVPAKPGREQLGTFSGRLMKFTKLVAKGRLALDRKYKGPRTPLGLNARLNSSGFRNDGSMLYGIQIERLLNDDPAASDYGFTDTYEQIAGGEGKFMHCRELNAAALDVFEDFLIFCRDNDLQVVSFLPPFADSVFNRMRESGDYACQDKLPGALAQLLERYGYEFYDFSQPSEFGSSDREVLDGFHGSEVSYQRMLLHMLERGSLLNRYCSEADLRRDLVGAPNRYVVYEN